MVVVAALPESTNRKRTSLNSPSVTEPYSCHGPVSLDVILKMLDGGPRSLSRDPFNKGPASGIKSSGPPVRGRAKLCLGGPRGRRGMHGGDAIPSWGQSKARFVVACSSDRFGGFPHACEVQGTKSHLDRLATLACETRPARPVAETARTKGSPLIGGITT